MTTATLTPTKEQEKEQEKEHPEKNTAELAVIAGKLTEACEVLGLAAPEFSTPPSIAGTRSIRRASSLEKCQIAVTVQDRLASAVIADMIDGICFINNIPPDDIEETHLFFWQTATS